jgi:hypothetical protein
MSATASYLYAITRPVVQQRLAGLLGMGGAPVRMLEEDDLACAVSTVNLDEFGEQALAANLEDLAWLERTVRQHDTVVREVSALATTMPLRLATICIDDTSARARIDDLRPRALSVLAALDGRDEWGVKLFASATDTRSERAAEEGEAGPPASGAAYLMRRRRQLERGNTAAEAAAQAAETVYRRLCELAVTARRHRPQDQRLSGSPQPMVLNAAFLVDRDRASEFQHAVTKLAADRPPESLVLTGPWPPYSFASGADE